MPIKLNREKFPPEIAEAIKLRLSAFVKLDDPEYRLLSDAMDQSVGERLPVLNMGVDEAATGGPGLAGAKPAGWRVLAPSGNDAAVAADVYATEQDRPWLVCVRSGPRISSILDAISRVPSALEKVFQTDQEFSLYLLLMPELFTDALLLKSDHGVERVFPYFTRIPDLAVMQPYDEKEFLDRLHPFADARKRLPEPEEFKPPASR
jgi:hypothetical protein